MRLDTEFADADLAQAFTDWMEAPEDGHTFTAEYIGIIDPDDDPLFLSVPADAVSDMLDIAAETWFTTQAIIERIKP